MIYTTKALPVAETEVRLYCKTSADKFYVCTGFYIPLGLKEGDSQYCWDDECIIYNEDEDCNYVDPGWYERIYN